MNLTYQIYDTSTLLGVMKEMFPPSTYWLDLCFGQNMIESEDEWVDFSKLTTGRKIAPFVAPLAHGQPIFSEGADVSRFKPGYIKAKDPVTAQRAIKKRPSEVLSKAPNTPMQRYNAIVADILGEHYNAVVRRWEWMAARAAIDGKVIVEGEGLPARLVDFKRDPNHTIVLTGGARWGQAGVSIKKNVEAWRTMVRRASFGGAVNRITVGAAVWDVMQNDQELVDQLNTLQRGTDANFKTGIREGDRIEYVGNISPTLPVYVYSEIYEDPILGEVDYMSENDIVMTGPGVEGYQCFGAILDKAAMLQAMRIFPKMWDEQDPSVTQIMTQSSPLMVPLNPNCTLKATVL